MNNNSTTLKINTQIKTLLFFLFFIHAYIANTQNDYILLKDGEKIIIQDGSIHSLVGSVGYYTPEKKSEWLKTIKLDLVQEIKSGGFDYLLYQKDGKKRKTYAYKILAQKDDKKLIYRVNTRGEYYAVYIYYILDKDNNYLAGSFFTHSGLKKRMKAQKEAIVEIKKHFSDCENVMTILNKYLKEKPVNNDNNGTTSMYIAGFLNHKVPLVCE